MRAAAVVLAATAAGSATTAASQAGKIPLGSLAASPSAVGSGRVWLLLSSALVADHPIGPSLAAFALLGLAAVAVCGPRVVWAVATLGHAGSAVAVYAAIFLVRVLDPGALAQVRSLYDYGTSAIIAAWIGAIAAQGWRKRPELTARSAVVAFCLGSGVIGWLLRPDVTVLDSEHVIAFLIGVSIARVRAERTESTGAA